MKLVDYYGKEFTDPESDKPYTDPDFLEWASTYYALNKEGNPFVYDSEEESTIWSAWDAWQYCKKLIKAATA